jgi:Putative motility protein
MDMNSIMASQLRSLQSLVQMSVLNKALTLNTNAATEMLEVLPDQAAAVHPTKGASIDVTA